MGKYLVEIETLSPIHIGNGNSIGLLDFWIFKENGRYFVYKYKLAKLLKSLDGELKNSFSDIIGKGDFVEIRNFLRENIDKLEEIIKNIAYQKLETDKYIFERWLEKINLDIQDCVGDSYQAKLNDFYNKLGNFQVQEFINQKGKYYIPGSSLKGAIRTCLDSKNDKWNPQNDPFKYLIVRDSEFVKDGLKLNEKWRLHNNIDKALQSRQGDGNYLEYIDSGTIIKQEIIIKEGFILSSKEELVKKIKKFTKEKIKKYLKQLGGNLEEEEYKKSKEKGLIDYYKFDEEKQSEEDIDAKIKKLEIVKSNLEYILDRFEELGETECILNLGFGGGYWFKCFEGEEKHPDKKLKKSRWQIARTSWKVFENLIDENNEEWKNWKNLGFIKLTFKD